MLSSIPSRKIIRDLPIPYYYQIVQILRELIQDIQAAGEDGEAPFPSEMELAEYFQVNRGTVRHALQILEREGLIYRAKGRGTFLQRRRVELDLSRLCSTTEDLKARGWSPASRLLGVSQFTPGLHIQRWLQLREEDTVWQVYRLRLANGEPISLEWSHIPTQVTPGLDEKDLSGSLYYLLKNEYGFAMKTAEQTIRTRNATPEEAGLLEIPAGGAVFEITRVSYDQAARPVEYLDSLWRGDRYDFHVRLQG